MNSLKCPEQNRLTRIFRKDIIYSSYKSIKYWTALLWNYGRFLFRKIRMQKEYAALNIIGLALGLALLIFVYLWVEYEHSYDWFHDKHERIFLVITDRAGKETIPYSSLSLGPALKKELKEVEKFCRIRFNNASLIGTRFHEQRLYLSDPTLFSIFAFPFVKGDPQTALEELNSIVITEETAARYFGDQNPLGKTLHIRQFNTHLKVTGVVKNIPPNSHIRFDLVARIEWLGNTMLESEKPSCNTYLLLDSKDSKQKVNKKIHEYLGKDSESGSIKALRLHPLTRIHWDRLDGDKSIKHIYFYLGITVVIWALASINLMILGASRFIKNAKEIGIRKVCGASRFQIMIQHLTESIMLSCIAFLPALVSVILFVPYFNHIFGKELGLHSRNYVFFLVKLVGIIPVSGILAGIYHAFVLSSIRPERVLKGRLSLDNQGFKLKKFLISIQFSVAIGLILCSFTVFKQLRLIKEKGLGFSSNSIVVVPKQVPYEAFREKLLENPNIVNITAASTRPIQARDEVYVRLAGQPQNTSFLAEYSMVDFEFFEMFGLKIVQGRSFSSNNPRDRNRTCVINESAARKLGSSFLLGKKIYFDHPAFAEDYKELEIIGIIEDHNLLSMHQALNPFIFRFYRPWHYLIFIKIKPGYIQKTLPWIEQVFKMFNPQLPFYSEFLDDTFSDLFMSEILMGWFFNAFGFSAILISCIGLFGLASYSAEYRTKEIGIRKIFGATVPGLVLNLSRELASCVILANIFAWPIVYFIMNKWLENYAIRTSLSLSLFLLTGLFALLLALLTSSSKIIKIAVANPIESLKYE